MVEFKYEINDQEVAFEICDDMAFINSQKKRYAEELTSETESLQYS